MQLWRDSGIGGLNGEKKGKGGKGANSERENTKDPLMGYKETY